MLTWEVRGMKDRVVGGGGEEREKAAAIVEAAMLCYALLLSIRLEERIWKRRLKHLLREDEVNATFHSLCCQPNKVGVTECVDVDR